MLPCKCTLVHLSPPNTQNTEGEKWGLAGGREKLVRDGKAEVSRKASFLRNLCWTLKKYHSETIHSKECLELIPSFDKLIHSGMEHSDRLSNVCGIVYRCRWVVLSTRCLFEFFYFTCQILCPDKMTRLVSKQSASVVFFDELLTLS